MSEWRTHEPQQTEPERVERGRAWVAYLKGVLAESQIPEAQRTPPTEDT